MEAIKALDMESISIIVTGIVLGTAARLITLRIDYRQIPSYPSAYFNNIVLGFIAATLGAVAIPALMTRDFVAVTFLTVAVQQFRDVRNSERESLEKLEHTEYTQRGEAYIDGISKTFESRYYISLVTALATTFIMVVFPIRIMALRILLGAVAGLLVMYFIYWFTKGKTIGDFCGVEAGQIEVKGSELYVDGIFVTNYLGTDHSRKLFKNEGMAVVLTPKNQVSRITLENYGQRQAVLFESVRALGVKRYKFTRRSFEDGRVVIALVPIIQDMEQLIGAVRNTPILENSRKIGKKMKTFGGGKIG